MPNWVGAVALRVAVGELLDAGPTRVERRALELAARLRAGLRERGLGRTLVDQADTSPLVSVVLSESVADVEAVLGHRGVRASVRGALGIRVLRVSCHGWNQPEDIDLLLDAVDDGVLPLRMPHDVA
jgi:selenocysteine lyase/cysteine desulfurase